MKKLLSLLLIAIVFASCNNSENQDSKDSGVQAEAQTFLNEYNQKYQFLLKLSSEGEWKLNTHIEEGDTITPKAAEEANQNLASFTGSKENIEKAQMYLAKKAELTPLQVKQFEVILYMAGSNPEIAADIVKQKIEAQTDQTSKLYGYDYQINGKSVSTNDIDKILRESTKLDERLAAWNASKEVGKGLKPGLEKLRDLRNQSVTPLGYSDFFSYQVAEYGMNNEEMMKVCHDMIADLWPLYRELHTWARYELAAKYKQPVPEMLPAHWLPNRWGQEWGGLASGGMDLNASLEVYGPEWIVKEGEKFYISLGFPELPQSFYERSSLYPLPEGTPYKKNNHASAWHMDNDKDVRSLMSVEPNTDWWETCLHELGHIYYFTTYSNPDVPIVLRQGANRAYHEAMGSLIGLAALQKPFLEEYGLVTADMKVDDMQLLLKEALNFVVVIPWSAGVMTEFENELYNKNLPTDQYNKKWWELARKYQGIVPPTDRGEEYCDAATKTHINDDAAQYYDYAISNILLFQFHDHIAKNILKEDPHATNYFNSKATGDFLKKLMYPGNTKDWRVLLKEELGSDMSAKPMVDYFQPLLEWLREQNRSRTHTLPETI